MAFGETVVTWFDGTWHKGNPTVARAADHGLWLGTVVFDGARLFDGVTPDLDRHLERVNRSAKTMGMEPTRTVEDMLELTREGLALLPPDSAAYIRPMYWTADGSSASLLLGEPGSTVFCLCIETLPMPKPEASVTLTRTRFMRPTLATATTDAKAACLYPNTGRMLREAADKGFANALVTDMLGNVVETATTNIFMARDGEVFTPVPNGSFLNGITRRRVISLLREDGVTVHEKTLGYADFEAADEVFTSGNLAKVMPVTAFDEVNYQHGPVAKQARSLYFDWAHST